MDYMAQAKEINCRSKSFPAVYADLHIAWPMEHCKSIEVNVM